MKQGLILLLLFFSILPTKAQKDTVWIKDLKQVVITYHKFKTNTIGTRTDITDSLFKSINPSSSVASLLEISSGLVIKSYGPGILATSSLRGGNSQQTALTWNGASLNSPVNGLSDLNLIPSFLFDDLLVTPGLSGSLQGNGAISGGINLGNNSLASDKLKKNLGVEILQTLGSFNNYSSGFKFKYSNGKWAHHSALFYNKNTNDYPFYNTSEIGNPKQYQSNARSKLVSVLHESMVATKKIGTLKFNYWHTFADRQIPPTMLIPPSEVKQVDQNLKTFVGWEKRIKKISFKMQSVLQIDVLNYTDINLGLSSNAKSKWLNTDFEMRLKTIKNSSTAFGAVQSFVTSHIGYNSSPLSEYFWKSNRNQLAFWASHFQLLYNGRLFINLGIRKEIVDQKQLPIIPSLGFRLKANKIIDVFGQVTRVFRLPTLNDLYWYPGGNLDLKPELGWASELSTEFHFNKKNTSIKTSITAFSKQVNNWIQWQPVNSQIWSPVNIGNVKSQGLEFRSTLKYKINHNFYTNCSINLDYTESSNSEKGSINYGKQLFYVPYFKSSGIAGIGYKKTVLLLSGLWVGKRFITSDHEEKLPAYGVLNIAINHLLLLKKTNISIFGKVNNVFNTSYQAIVWRPMPGINYELGVNIKFQKK